MQWYAVRYEGETDFDYLPPYYAIGALRESTCYGDLIKKWWGYLSPEKKFALREQNPWQKQLKIKLGLNSDGEEVDGETKIPNPIKSYFFTYKIAGDLDSAPSHAPAVEREEPLVDKSHVGGRRTRRRNRPRTKTHRSQSGRKSRSKSGRKSRSKSRRAHKRSRSARSRR